MTSLTPYLEFNGDCAAAFAYYAKVLDGEIEMMMRFGDMPESGGDEPVAEADKHKIMHASLKVGEQRLMGSDHCSVSPAPFAPAQGFSVSVHIADLAKARQTFMGLAEGGQVRMPFAQTFWAQGFGMCVDRFGIPWMVNCEQASCA